MRIGFIGLGVMGAPMSANLLEAGYELVVHNRTRAKEEPLADKGAERAATPAEAASDADLVITMVTDSPQLREVLTGPEGVIETAAAGSLVIDMSTVDPEVARESGDMLGERGVGFIDAPVSGGSEGAQAGTLSIMAGGDIKDVDRARPIFEVLGDNITHCGELGMGQTTKAVNQVIVAGTFMAVAEGMYLAKKAGLDPELAMRATATGAASSWALSRRGPRMIERDYPLGFKMSLHRKDLRIASEIAGRSGAKLDIASHVAKIEDRLIAEGWGDSDVSAIHEALWSSEAPRLPGMPVPSDDQPLSR